MARTAEFYIESAHNAFEAGFLSEAARKRALNDLSYAYSIIKSSVLDAILTARPNMSEEENHNDYWEFPYSLHHVRAKHFEIAAKYTEGFAIVEDLIELRKEIKAAEIIKVPVNEQKERVEQIRKSIFEIIEQRKAQYIEAVEVGRLFGGLPVSVNAHIVHGHKGTVFVRHFFYLRGKLTPLQVILAAADTLEREKEA